MITDKATLYSFFETGDIPTQQQFRDLIDTEFSGVPEDYTFQVFIDLTFELDFTTKIYRRFVISDFDILNLVMGTTEYINEFDVSFSSFAVDNIVVDMSLFPALAKLSFNNVSGIDAINFPALATFTELIMIAVEPSGGLLKTTVGSLAGLSLLLIELSNNNLTEAAVDGVLADMDAVGNLNGTIDLSGGTNAPPSAAGLVSKASLEGKGWTITVN